MDFVFRVVACGLRLVGSWGLGQGFSFSAVGFQADYEAL